MSLDKLGTKSLLRMLSHIMDYYSELITYFVVMDHLFHATASYQTLHSNSLFTLALLTYIKIDCLLWRSLHCFFYRSPCTMKRLPSKFLYSKGNLAYLSLSPGLFSLRSSIFFCSDTGTFIPPCAVLSVLASFSGSPAVQILCKQEK